MGTMESTADTVLVVDDDDDVRFTTGEFLRLAGYRVLEAATVPLAREILAQETVDLIVLDILMPGTDGSAFLRQQKELGRAGRPPVLVATSLSEMALMRACLQQGAADFIHKPLTMAAVRDTVAKILERSREAARAAKGGAAKAVKPAPDKAADTKAADSKPAPARPPVPLVPAPKPGGPPVFSGEPRVRKVATRPSTPAILALVQAVRDHLPPATAEVAAAPPDARMRRLARRLAELELVLEDLEDITQSQG